MNQRACPHAENYIIYCRLHRIGHAYGIYTIVAAFTVPGFRLWRPLGHPGL